ncbi:MAG: GAF domain-containing sensor histidine kinase [Chloroflexota bacterium]|nr:MAG: GAF domain-containing sensor histidine kinase [Chloroflexota bacterium]
MVVLTREQLEERILTLHQASLELVGVLSLDEVLVRIVDLARAQAGARYAALGMIGEDGKIERFIPVGMTPEQVKRIGEQPEGKGMLGAVMVAGGAIRIPKITEDPRSRGFPPHHPEMQPFLGVPIISGERMLGLIYLTDKEEHFEFTEADQRIIEILAAYAAVAISNAQLYQDVLERDKSLRKRNQDLALINNMAAAVTSSLEIDNILQQALDRVLDYLDVEAGEIFMADESGQILQLATHLGDIVDSFWTRDSFSFGEGPIGQVAESGKPMVSIDPEREVGYFRNEVIESGLCCVACIPMATRGSVVGVMCVAAKEPQNFDERVLDLLLSIGTWAALSIENVRLGRQSRRLAVLEERERIGMDLHDGIIQSIYAIGLALDYARSTLDEEPDAARSKINQAIEGLDTTIRDIRSYILDLRPRQFRGEDLMQGLEQLVEEFNANSRSQAILIGPRNGLEGLPTANATALFHICQEALANAAKHAKAGLVDVRLLTSDERVMMEVTDDGLGFDIRKMSATLGHGLSNMHFRAQKVGGDVEINSEPGSGTSVIAWVPRYTQ